MNNAGITKDGLAMRMKKDDWDAVLATNLTGAFLAIQQVLPAMMKERWGRIINISSIVGETGNPGQANYVASKAGLIGLTKSLAQEIASRNVTVNAVAPGFIETDMTAVLSDEVKNNLLAHIPLKRFGKAGRRRRCRAISGERRSRLHHRARAGRQRRNVYVESARRTLIENVRGVAVDHGSERPPACSHAFAHETLRDTDQRNSASRCDVTGGGIVADEQPRASDFGGEGSEGSIMGSHTGR